MLLIHSITMLFENDGSNRDVILQWIDRDYLVHSKKDYRKKVYKEEIQGISFFDRKTRKDIKKEVYSDFDQEKKELERIIVGPDEYAVVIKDGRIEATYTQKQVDELPGFWGRIAERFAGGAEDIQVMLADTRKHPISIPFSAFTKDRIQVKGAVELFASINVDDVALALRIIREVQGARVNDKIGFRQLTVDDVKEVIRSNLNYVIDTESISEKTAAELEKDRRGICLDLISALNSKTPYWANYGLAVNYSTIEFSENRYEELERLDAENKLKIRELDIGYVLSEAQSGGRVRAEDLMERERAMLSISGQLADYGAEVALSTKRKDATIAKEDDESEIRMRVLENKNRYETTLAYHERELRRIRDYDIDDTEKELRISEIKSRIQEIQLDIQQSQYEFELKKRKDEVSLEESSKDAEVRRQIELMQAKAAAVRAMAAGDEEIRKMEIARGIDEQRQQAEIEKAAAQAKLEGYKEADATKHQQHMDELHVTKDMLGAANKGLPQNDAQIRCPKCNKFNKPSNRYCSECGSELYKGDE